MDKDLRELLKVGDKVWLRDDLTVEGYDTDGGNWLVERMIKDVGTEVEITEVDDDCINYFDGKEFWLLTEHMIDWDKTCYRDDNLKFTEGLGRGFKKISLNQWMLEKPQDVDVKQWMEIYDVIKLPNRKTKHSAGYDIHSPFTFTLEPEETIKVPTGIKAYMEHDEVMYIHIRSSLGFKYKLQLDNVTGIGDSDYFNNEGNEGHYFVKITNFGDKSVTINKGDAFSQAIFHKYLIANNDSFNDGEIRKGGIGSTDE